MIPLPGLVLAAALAATPPHAAGTVTQTILEHRIDTIADRQIRSADPRTLLDPRRQSRAERFRIERRVLLVLSLLVPAFVLYRLWSSGSAASLRGAVSRATPPRLRTFVFTLALLGVGWLAALPFNFLDYRVNRLYGLTRQPPAEWFGAWIVQAAIATLLLSLVAASILWLSARTRVWYLYAAGGVVVAMLGLAYVDPVAITPLMTSSKPLDPASFPVYTQRAMAASHAGAFPIYVGDVPRTGLAAGVEGLGATRRIVVADYVIASATAREKAFVILREIGRLAQGDALRSTLLFAAFGIVTLVLAVGLADRVPFRPDDDPLSRVALVGASALLFSGLVWLPVAYTLRSADAAADRFALRVTNDPIAAERSIVRTADELLIPYCTQLDWVFPDVHQPPGTRIAAIRGTPNPCR